MDQIDDIKSSISVRDVLIEHGVEIKGVLFRCIYPDHPDEHPSSSLYGNDQRFHCHSCGKDGDVIDCYALLNGLNNARAIERLMTRLGLHNGGATTAPTRTEGTLRLPQLENGTNDELGILATLRNLDKESLRTFRERGLLWFADMFDGSVPVRGWVITDGRRVNAQARRLDGKPWESLPEKPKAKTIAKSKASWPIGIMEAHAFPGIALCEGGPDMLAAFHFAWAEGVEDMVAPVCMTGASLSIHEAALPYFAGKKIRIFPHIDEAGKNAAVRWERQLRRVSRDVECFNLANIRLVNGVTAKDLNDVCYFHPDDFEDDRELWRMLSFAEDQR